jgi:hypothetical protein
MPELDLGDGVRGRGADGERNGCCKPREAWNGSGHGSSSWRLEWARPREAALAGAILVQKGRDEG